MRNLIWRMEDALWLKLLLFRKWRLEGRIGDQWDKDISNKIDHINNLLDK